MMLPLLCIVGADKGGSGKTTTARTLADYLEIKHANQRIFDAQWPKGDLVRFAPAAKVINIETAAHLMNVFDSISGVTLVDICAGQLGPTLGALNSVGLLDDVRAKKLNLALFHVLGSSFTSLREIAEIAGALGDGVKHFLVKNYGAGGGFEEWEKDGPFSSALKAAEALTITIPHMKDRAYSEIQLVGGSLSSFIENEKHSYMLRGYARTWRNSIWSEFHRVGLDALIAAAVGG